MINRRTVISSFALAVALSSAIAPIPVLAAEFGAESASVWSARSRRIHTAVMQPVERSDDAAESQNIAGAYFSGVKDACTGITGEHIKYGGRNMPVWAQSAQGSFCGAADELRRTYNSGKKDKKYCGMLKNAISNARKATPRKSPDEVVETAGLLIEASEYLYKSKVTFQRASLFGSSEISFSCQG